MLATLHGVVAFLFPSEGQGTQKCHFLRFSVEVVESQQPLGRTAPENLLNGELESTV